MTTHGTTRERDFDANKALAALGYLVQQSEADLYSVMKMLYLADKEHLSRYGRTVTGDDFTAMEHGPLPEHTYGLCKFVRGQKVHFDAMPDAREHLALDGNVFRLLSPPDLDALSISDRRALDSALTIYAGGGWQAVRAASHDAAWDAAWASARARGVGSISIALETIVASLPNAAQLMDYLSDPHPGEAEHCST